MKWVYKTLMAASTVGLSLVTAGIAPATLALVFGAVGTAAGYFHEAPAKTPA